MPGPALRILPVASKADRERFIRFPETLYADDPVWVAPLRLERRAHLDPRRNPFFRHAEAALWLAERDGEVVGRISAQIDQAALDRHPGPAGFFGFLEAVDEAAVFSTLLGTAEDWLRQRGMRRVLGPMSFSINDEVGLLVEGFETPPAMMMPHGRRYYPTRLAEQGYAKAKDLLAYDFPLTLDSVPAAARKLVDRVEANPAITVRPLRRKELRDEVRRVVAVFNDAWSNNWGFVPITDEELDKLARDMKPLLQPDFVAIAEMEGEPVAFAVALPDINEAIADLHGSLLPFGWAKLLYRLKANRIKSGRLPLMGVRRRLQGTPLGAALAFAVIARVHGAFARRGYRRGELSWILEDNLPMRRILEAIGAVPYKTYRVFEKALA